MLKKEVFIVIRKSGEYTVQYRPCGGSQNDFELRHRFSKEEMFGKTRLCAEIVFQPGDVIPLHRHGPDAEIYYMLEGELVSISEDGTEEPFTEGDYMATGGGAGHSVRNDSGKMARMLAIVIE